MSFKRSNFRWKHETTPTQWYIYIWKYCYRQRHSHEGKPLFFSTHSSPPPPYHLSYSSANRYGTPSIYFCFFLFPLFFSFHPSLLLIANLIYREDWGVQKREIAVYCQIELWAQRTAPATTVAAAAVVKEIATQRWLTRVMHRPYYRSCLAATPQRQSVSPFRISCA